MSTYFNPTKRITVSRLEEIFQKYDELKIEEVEHNIFESTEKDDAGLPILIDEKIMFSNQLLKRTSFIHIESLRMNKVIF